MTDNHQAVVSEGMFDAVIRYFSQSGSFYIDFNYRLSIDKNSSQFITSAVKMPINYHFVIYVILCLQYLIVHFISFFFIHVVTRQIVRLGVV